MADRTISELDPVKESPIGGLPEVLALYDDTLLPVEQQGAAMRMTGRQFRQFGEKTAEIYVQTAVDAAESAKADAGLAQEMRQSIQMDYEYIDTARQEAQESAEAAGKSEAAAKASEDAARASREAASASEENAANSETAAAESQKAAAGSEAAAKDSEERAAASQTAAAESREAAAGSAEAAKKSETASKASATAAGDYAKYAQSYTEGNTETRPGEEVDNARYYYEQAKRVSQGLSGALLPMGTVAFDQLAAQSKEPGYMYNIRDDFVTDGSFAEGEGHLYPAGTNVYYTAEGAWDCLAGTQVVSVNGQTGAVMLGRADVGLDRVDNTPDTEKNVASAAKLAHALSFTGGVSGSYDGSAAKSVAIPAASSTVPKPPATAGSAGSEAKWARGDHVHPAQTTITGNAATASKLANGATINGVLFDGSKAITIKPKYTLIATKSSLSSLKNTWFNVTVPSLSAFDELYAEWHYAFSASPPAGMDCCHIVRYKISEMRTNVRYFSNFFSSSHSIEFVFRLQSLTGTIIECFWDSNTNWQANDLKIWGINY